MGVYHLRIQPHKKTTTIHKEPPAGRPKRAYQLFVSINLREERRKSQLIAKVILTHQNSYDPFRDSDMENRSRKQARPALPTGRASTDFQPDWYP